MKRIINYLCCKHKFPLLNTINHTSTILQNSRKLYKLDNRFSSSLTLINTSTPKNIGISTSNQTTYKENEINVIGRDVPAPFLNFDDYPWPKKVYDLIKIRNLIYPTPIQCQGWPIALEGRDLIGIAMTGSGKTWAYLLPAFVHIENRIEKNISTTTPKVLIIGPTRELVQQIETECKAFNYFSSVCVYGGSSRQVQLEKIRSLSPQILVGTPGRLNDFLDCNMINLTDIKYLVIDEADLMLNMGFEPQIRHVLSKCPKQRQTLMWSATWPQEVQDLANEFLNDFIKLNIGSSELHANTNIEQNFKFVDPKDKANCLLELLKEIAEKKSSCSNAKILIFAMMKRTVDYLSRLLNSRGMFTNALHGDKTQAMRNTILEEFKSGKRRILVASDVAARGLDIKDIDYVINYDMPVTAQDYIHRIGRTGRQNKKGVSYSFFTLEDIRVAPGIIKILKVTNQKIDPQLEDLARRYNKELSVNQKNRYNTYRSKNSKYFYNQRR